MPSNGLTTLFKTLSFSKVRRKALRLVGKRRPGSPHTDSTSEEEPVSDIESPAPCPIDDTHGKSCKHQAGEVQTDSPELNNEMPERIEIVPVEGAIPLRSPGKRTPSHEGILGDEKLRSSSSPSSKGMRSALSSSSAASSACTIPSELNSLLSPDAGLAGLEEAEEEMKELKRVLSDAKYFRKAPELQQSISALAAKRSAALKKKLNPEPLRSDSEQNADPISISVDAMDNRPGKHRSRRKTGAEAAVHDFDDVRAEPATNPGRVLKHARSSRCDTSKPDERIWRDVPGDMSSPSPVAAIRERRSTLSSECTERSTLSSEASSACTIPSEFRMSTYKMSDPALVALEAFEDEMKELKRVFKDAKRFQDSPDLQRSISAVAAKRKATLQRKLNCMSFDGNDKEAFEKWQERMVRVLQRLTVVMTPEAAPSPVLDGAVGVTDTRDQINEEYVNKRRARRARQGACLPTEESLPRVPSKTLEDGHCETELR